MSEHDIHNKLMEEIDEKKPNFGELLDLIRTKSGMTCRDFARALGVQESTVYRLVKGDTDPSIEFMNRLRALSLLRPKDAGSDTPTDRFTVASVIAGLTAIARTTSFGSIAGFAVGSMVGGILGSALTFGVIKAIRQICDKNKLDCQEVDNTFEIRKKAEPEDGR